MKHYLILLLILWQGWTGVQAQSLPYRVVFDLTSSDTAVHHSLLRLVGEITATHPEAQLEAVFYGQSLGMLKKDNADAQKITSILSKPNVTFAVCQVAMKRHNLSAGDLLPGVKTVPDGVYEILQKAHEGWGYIKLAR